MPKNRLVYPLAVWILLAIFAAVAFWLQFAGPIGDGGAENMLTYSAIVLAVFTVCVWLVFRAGARGRRVKTLATIAVVVAVPLVLFRVDSFSGDMVPKFVFRFAADRELESNAHQTGIDLATTTPWDFPQFLGPARDASVSSVRLGRDWSANPPTPLWRQPIGAGWSGFAVVNGYAVTMEQRGELEMITCYAVETGKLAWSHAVENRFASIIAGDGPRATPTIDEGVVFAMTNRGLLLALDGRTGKPRWSQDVRTAFGGTPADDESALPYGRSNSPLVLGGLLVVPAGGTKDRRRSLVAYDKFTGAKVWDGGNRQISMSSPAVATLAGVEQVLIVNEDSASGHDAKTGAVLWEHAWPGGTNTDANVSQAVPQPPNRVWLSKGYGLGASLLELTRDPGGAFTVKPLWHNRRVLRTKFTNVTIRDGHAYGLSDGILECVDVETGNRVWKGGRYRHGQILRVHDLLVVLSERGEVFLVEATPDRTNHVLGRFQALEGKTWNTIALYGPTLLVRNAEEAAAYRLPLAE